MSRYFSFFVSAILLATVPVAYGPGQSAVHAQTEKQERNGPTIRRIEKQFGKRVASVVRTATVSQYRLLDAELLENDRLLFEQAKLFSPENSYRTEAKRREAAKRWSDIQAARILINAYNISLARSNDPESLNRMIQRLKYNCNPQEAAQLLEKFGKIVQQYKARLDAAKLAGKRSKISPVIAKGDYDNAKKWFERAKNYQSPECKDKTSTGDADGGGEVIELDDIVGGPDAEQVERDPCDRINDQTDPVIVGECRAWASILGTWVNREYGGSITFRLRADRTVSAYIGTANERMRYYGYDNGMEILNGLQLAGTNGATWLVWTKSGFEFAAKMPSRKPGQTFGQAAWNQTGMIFIDKKNPNAISLPGQLKWRLSNGKAWVRQ